MTSPARPDLRVEVPPEGSGPPAANTDDSSSSSTKWGKYLQSPGALMGKTASFTAKLAGGMGMAKKPGSQREMTRSRTSVDPYRRAALDAEYRTTLTVREQEAAAAVRFFFLVFLAGEGWCGVARALLRCF